MQVLCASNATHDQVDPISPPEGAAVGERVTFEGYSGEPEPQLNPKKKVFEKLAPDLTTNAGAASLHAVPHVLCLKHCKPGNLPMCQDLCCSCPDGVAVFKGIPMMTSKGPVTASIPNAHVK